MERQWFTLKQDLAGNDAIAEKEINEPFFQRILLILRDPNAGPADKAKACQDALCCATAHGISDVSLEIPGLRLSETELSRASLIVNRLTGRISLIEHSLSNEEVWVYRREQRRYLLTPNIDVSLSKALKSGSYTHYNGRGQQAAVRTTLTSPEDSTLIINLPTGCGKTLVAHSLVLFSPSHQLNLVVVPTVGLAIEQGARVKEVLKQAGLDHGGPYAWYGNQGGDERQRVLEKVKAGVQRVLLCSPEAATGSLSPHLFQLAENDQIGSLVIDEAHLIDAWGDEFRPEFQMLAPFSQSLQRASKRGFRKVLMSATFNPHTLDTLKNLFCSKNNPAIEVNGSFLRPEPSYHLVKTNTREEHHAEVLNAVLRMPRPLILYTTQVDEAKLWYFALNGLGFSRIGLFHGETATVDRERLINSWREGQLDVMVATSAFGVGMDKADVRSVVHAAVPENLDRFYQESGRGGRDGNASLATLIYHPSQIEVAQNLSQSKLIGTELGLERWEDMLRSAQEAEHGHWTVSLATIHKRLDRKSKRNKSWNWRTLLLMRRAGLIDIHLRPFSPPKLEDGEDWSAESYQKRLDAHYRECSETVDIEIINDGHRDENVWNTIVAPRREKEKKAKLKAFVALTDWLKDPEFKLCSRLSEFYTHDGISPEIACGGCSGCRHDGLDTHTPTLGLADEVTGWPVNAKNLEQHSLSSLTFVHYSKTSPVRFLLSDWKHWIGDLLNKGSIQAIRGESSTLEQLKTALPPGIQRFWCAIDNTERDSQWSELILIMPHETKLPEFGFVDFPRIVVAPNDIPSLENPYRKWWETGHVTIEIEHFLRQLTYVHNQ